MQVIKFKKFTHEELDAYLSANNLFDLKKAASSIFKYIEEEKLMYIVETSLFDGYRVFPCLEFDAINGAMKERIDIEYYNFWNKSDKRWIPQDMFDQRTLSDRELPYGMHELMNPTCLFKISNDLQKLFDTVPRNNLHSFLAKYSQANMSSIKSFLSHDSTEWPLTLAIAYSDPEKIAYFTAGKIYEMLKQQYNGFAQYFDESKSLRENLYDPELRQSKGTMAPFATAFAKLAKEPYYCDWTTQHLSQFCDAFFINAFEKMNYTFELRPASRIMESYDGNNYLPDCSGTLGRSCMRSEGDQHKIRWYQELGSEVVEILCLIDDAGWIIGRALVWQNVYNRKRKDSFMVMDRVYTTNNRYESLFHDYAIKEGWMRKAENSYKNNKLVQPDGKAGIGQCFMQLPSKLHKGMSQSTHSENYDPSIKVVVPWLDTFKYYDSLTHTLTTHKQLAATHFMQNCHGAVNRINRHDRDIQIERAHKLLEIMTAKNLEPITIEN